MIVVVVVLLLEIVGVVYGAKMVQINRSGDGSDVHRLIGHVIWIASTVLVLTTVAATLEAYLW